MVRSHSCLPGSQNAAVLSQSVTPLRLVAVVGLVSTLTHTISVRVDESPAATATTTALNYCRQPAPVSLRCFDVACRAEGKSLVGPLNVGLSLSLPYSLLLSRVSFPSAFANVLRGVRPLANYMYLNSRGKVSGDVKISSYLFPIDIVFGELSFLQQELHESCACR